MYINLLVLVDIAHKVSHDCLQVIHVNKVNPGAFVNSREYPRSRYLMKVLARAWKAMPGSVKVLKDGPKPNEKLKHEIWKSSSLY